MAERASFTRMRDGTVEEYRIIAAEERSFRAGLGGRILVGLEALRGGLGGYPVDRLTHSLQSATRAERDGRPDRYIAACLVHDIGDLLAPQSHGSLAAAVVRPYVDERLTWIVEHHPVFQQRYYGRQMGLDPDVADRFRDHPWYDDAVEFCESYDENCFDAAYRCHPLEHFAPLVHEVFGITATEHTEHTATQ